MYAVKRFYKHLLTRFVPLGIMLTLGALGLYYGLLEYFNFKIDMLLVALICGLILARDIRPFLKDVLDEKKRGRQQKESEE